MQCPDDIIQSVCSPGEDRHIWFQLLLYCTVVLCGIANPLLTFAKHARIVLRWETDARTRPIDLKFLTYRMLVYMEHQSRGLAYGKIHFYAQEHNQHSHIIQAEHSSFAALQN